MGAVGSFTSPSTVSFIKARLSKNANYLLEDIDKNTVAMTNNYDDTTLEPTVLPARYPLLLVNGSTGIASGYATNIAPHNLPYMQYDYANLFHRRG